MKLASIFVSALVLALAAAAHAAVIDVSPSDSDEVNMDKIEGAAPGDEVVVAPGTYRFRLYLEGAGTADQPIVIRAADPADRPVWDFEGGVVESWPGSYTGGDSGRSMWQVTGSYYFISGIVFRNGTDGGSGDSGGLRFKSSDHVTLHDCLFQLNDNGIQGSGTETLVEFCEFDRNGLPGSSEASHNLYIHGGSITVRYCYIHDAQRAQNLHIRAFRSVFEYNWIARPMSYMGDMMPCTMDPCESDQTMLLRGNVFLRGSELNDGQVFVMYNDQGSAGTSFSLTMIDNTVIGNGDGAALVHFANEDPSLNLMQTAVLSNNVIYDVADVFRIDDPGLSNWSAGGRNNWLSEGTGGTEALEGTVTGTDPGLADLSALNLVPTPTSPLIGAADTTISDLPDKEYYRDETLAMHWRARLSVNDIGAFESTTTGTAVGPYDETPPADTDEDPDPVDVVEPPPDADVGPDLPGEIFHDVLDGPGPGDGGEEEPGDEGGGGGCGCSTAG
jgi:hypothetical protein